MPANWIVYAGVQLQKTGVAGGWQHKPLKKLENALPETPSDSG